MMVRMQISMPPEQHRAVKARAHSLGISASDYVRRLAAVDLAYAKSRGRIDAIFGLGDSGGSDVEQFDDQYAVAAVVGTWHRGAGRDESRVR